MNTPETTKRSFINIPFSDGTSIEFNIHKWRSKEEVVGMLRHYADKAEKEVKESNVKPV